MSILDQLHASGLKIGGYNPKNDSAILYQPGNGSNAEGTRQINGVSKLGINPSQFDNLGPQKSTNPIFSSGRSLGNMDASQLAQHLTNYDQGQQQTQASQQMEQRTLNGQPGADLGVTGGTGASGGQQVYRDLSNNFFLVNTDGSKTPLSQADFQNLGINEKFVQPGQTASLSQSTIGHEGGNTAIVQQVLDGMKAKGLTINPNVPITPQAVAEFMSFAANNVNNFLPYAQKESAQYYSTQLKLASDTLHRSLGYSDENIAQKEKEYQTKYSEDLKNIGVKAADVGFAQSGARVLDEQNLARDTQTNIDTGRRDLAYNEGNTVGNFAQKYGSDNLPTPGSGPAPRVLPGQSKFDTSGQSSPFYNLSPDVYNGLTGTEQFAQRSGDLARAGALEKDYNTYNAVRTLPSATT